MFIIDLYPFYTPAKTDFGSLHLTSPGSAKPLHRDAFLPFYDTFKLADKEVNSGIHSSLQQRLTNDIQCLECVVHLIFHPCFMPGLSLNFAHQGLECQKKLQNYG